MPQMLVQHKVQDYDKWKILFDVSLPVRKMAGEKSCRIFRNTEDPNDLTILFDWKDAKLAIQYSESEELKTAMKASGVLDTPKVYLLPGDMET